jgi:threonine dehydrogenase-like Zn-dependent dehydrogenase
MRALVLYDRQQFEVRDVEAPQPGPNDVLVRIDAVGLCGTDFHIYGGHANYHTDERGQPVPLTVEPQILGHEFCGEIVEVGRNVSDLALGDRVLVDQGINCSSRHREVLCEYCATGNSHQCADYAEHGITGLQGALAEVVSVPARNAVKISSGIAPHHAAVSEPLGCIIHASNTAEKAQSRYQFHGENKIRNVLVLGAGPAGLLFVQYLRKVIGFEGLLMVSEPNRGRRLLAERYGAATIDPGATDLVSTVKQLTNGERVHYLIEAAGIASTFREMPGLLRKQATVLLYGHGQHGVDLGVLNNIQFLEPALVAPIGASGGFDADGRPAIYRRALELVESGTIDVSGIITNLYQRLEDVPAAFASDHTRDGYIKGVVLLSTAH